MKFDFATFPLFPNITVAVLEVEPDGVTMINVARSSDADPMDEAARQNRALSLCLQTVGMKNSEAKAYAADLINSNPQR